MVSNRKKIERCAVCLQPATGDYVFKLVYYEEGEKVVKWFCGGTCLRRWVEGDLDKTHLGELESLE
jgi:hypothetical protein